MDIFFNVGLQRFVWNHEKADANWIKHGVRFEEAAAVLKDPLLLLFDASTNEEQREAALGMTLERRLLFVVHIVRESDLIRIISAREATRQERRSYEEYE